MTAMFASHRLEDAVRILDARLAAPAGGQWPPTVVEIAPADAADPDCAWALARIAQDGEKVNVSVSVTRAAAVEDYISERPT